MLLSVGLKLCHRTCLFCLFILSRSEHRESIFCFELWYLSISTSHHFVLRYMVLPHQIISHLTLTAHPRACLVMYIVLFSLFTCSLCPFFRVAACFHTPSVRFSRCQFFFPYMLRGLVARRLPLPAPDLLSSDWLCALLGTAVK